MSEFFASQPVTVVLVVLIVYFAAKLLAVATKIWVPRNRKLTLSEHQLKGWRVLVSLEAGSMILIWAGILVGTKVDPCGFAAALVGVALYAVIKWLIMKRYPYIDPATVKKTSYENGKKVKKKKK